MRLFKKKKEFKKTSWADITVRDVIEIREIGELQLATEDEKNIKVAALLAGVKEDELMAMPFDKLAPYMENTQFLLTPPVQRKARNKYVINGRTYKLFKSYDEMTVAQYIDFQAIQPDGFDKKPAELLSIFLIPAGHEYNDGYDREQVFEDMLDMGIEEALGVCGFFIKRCWNLIRLVPALLKTKMRLVRMTAPKEDREMLKATELQMNLVLGELEDMYGWLALKQFPTSPSTTGKRSSK